VHQLAAIQKTQHKKGAVMKVVRTISSIALLLAFLMVLPAARADQSNQATKVTFSQSVQIPGRVLAAGTYWFVMPEKVTEHNQVRIYNADQTIYYGTVFMNNAERREPTDTSSFIFAERNFSEPQALISWFYPGDKTGHEFVYPKRVSKELAKDKQITVVAGD
jgi:hypothetical protein